MAHDTTSGPRHLRAVPTDDVPVGVTWEADPDENARYERVAAELRTGAVDDDQEVPASEPLPPLEATRVYAQGEVDNAVSPAKATLAEVNDRLKAGLEAANTYALLAWSRRWQTVEAYVMDPGLYEEVVEEARAEIRRQRAAAAKKLDKAQLRKDTAQVKLLSEELAELEKRTPSAMKMEALTLRARGGRLARQAAVPAAVMVGPLAALFAGGLWWPLLTYPVAWGWLAIQGRAMAHGETTTTATEAPAPEHARPLAAPAAPAPGEPTVQVMGASAEENVVLARLERGYWNKHAKARGLEGITPGGPVLDDCGICVPLALGGKWTPAKTRAETGRIRAMLAIPEGAGVQIMPGETGDQAVLRIRTRTPDLDTRWSPERRGIGVVPDTGRVVDLDAYGHRVVAGTTGSGKSTSMRPWMASVVLNPLAALVFIDPKGQEAGLWEHCARTVKGVGPRGRQRMYALICELESELQWRQENAEGTDWTPTKEHPELVINVDEGAALVRMAKINKYKDVLDKIEFIASQGRACKMWVHWATQYPTKADGIPAQVTENITNRLSLAVDSPQADRVVFGEQATATGWTPSELDMPGWSMVRTGPKDVPEHVLMVHMTDEQVKALPEGEPWRHGDAADDEVQEDEDVHDDEDDDEGDDWIGAQEAVMAALKSNGPRTTAQLMEVTGYSKARVNQALKELQGASRVTKGAGHRAAWRAL